MRDDQIGWLRWWNTLRPAERIVAMSLIAGGTIAIINSTVWAAAVCYMTRQRTLAVTARAQSEPAGQIGVSDAASPRGAYGSRELAGGAQ